MIYSLRRAPSAPRSAVVQRLLLRTRAPGNAATSVQEVQPIAPMGSSYLNDSLTFAR
jgi:hypothetical protein